MKTGENMILTEAQEDFLKNFYYIMEEDRTTTVTAMAVTAHVSKSSITQMSGKLAQKNLLIHNDYSKMMLTLEGYKIAEKLTAKHRIIEVFLKEFLQIQEAGIHSEAHLLEHAFSDESIDKLNRFLNNPSTDPHGSRIPQVEFD